MLCRLVSAQVPIWWGPRCYIDDGSGPEGSTTNNNTWSVVGCGCTVAVAYVREGHATFARSVNNGQSWEGFYQLDQGLNVTSEAPSLLKLDESGKHLIATFLTSGKDVYVVGSVDWGESWIDLQPARGGDENDEFFPSAQCHPVPDGFESVQGLDADVAWWAHEDGELDSVGTNRWHFNYGESRLLPQWSANHYIPEEDEEYGYPFGAPSIWSFAHQHHSGVAWQSPPDSIATTYAGDLWRNDVVMLKYPYYDVGFPSIACLESLKPRAQPNHPETLPGHEMVAFEAKDDPQASKIGLGVGFRSWDGSRPNNDWVCVYLPQQEGARWPWLENWNLRDPNVCGHNKGGQGRVFFMTFTGYVNSAGLRHTLYTRIWNDPNGEGHSNPNLNPDYDWHADLPGYFAFCADSVCISTAFDKAYALFHSREFASYENGAAVKVGQIPTVDRPLPIVVAAGRAFSGRRLAKTPGTDALHRVLDAFDFVSYVQSTDNGETWFFQDAPDWGSCPAMALYHGNPFICYLRNDSVLCARLKPDTGWVIKTIFAGTSACKPGIPSLAVFPNAGAGSRMANACFPLYSSTTGGSRILLAQFDTAETGGVVLDTISQNAYTYGDSAVTVVCGLIDTIQACFEHGDSIYYKYLRFSSTTSSRPDTWTKNSLVNAGGTSAQHPQAEKIGSRFYVTYSEHWTEGGNTIWAIKRTSTSDITDVANWEGTGPVSDVNVNPKDFPSISTPDVVAWAESSSMTNHWVIKASVADSVLTLTSPDSNSKFVSILADTAVQTTPSTSTTGIYYLWLQQYSGDTWQVPYAGKQVLTSNAEASVTRYNQGRKLLLSTDDTLSSVYRTAAGSIYYSKKKDGVEGWTSSLLRSTGQFPCLTEDYLNRTWVAEHDATSPSTHLIRCQNRAAGSNSWHDFSVYSVSGSGPAFSRIGPPSIVACQNDSSGQNRSAAYIVFTVYTTIPVKSTIVMAKVDTLGVVYVDTLHYVTTYGDSFPSIAACPVAGPGYGLDVAFQSGTEVYTKKTTNSEHPEFTTKRTWSPSYNLSNTPLKSKHPLIAADADTVLVAWVEGDSGAIVTKGQGPGSGYTVWGGLVSVSACPDTVCDNPTIALGDSIIVAYHKKLSATNYDVIARVNFNSNLNLSNSTTTSKYPHCAFHFHNDSFPVISTVWTEELSTNYAEVAYKRWQLGEEDGGGIQNAGFFDPNIHPCLFAPSPNPFNGLTSIRYSTNIKGLTRVTVMDITGRRVRNLLTMPQSPGIYNLTWNARDDRERQLPRGVYFVRLQTENYSEARKLILTE